MPPRRSPPKYESAAAFYARRPCPASCGPLLSKQCVNEPLWIECLDVLRRLTEADELDRNLQLITDGDDDTPLGRAIELGKHNAGDLDCLSEILRLQDSVLSCCGIKHQQHFVRRSFDPLGHNIS